MRKAAVSSPFDITVKGTGSFSQRDGKLLWGGVLPSPQAETLYKNLGAALKQEGFKVENRPFRPHITLIRRVPANVHDFPALREFSIPVDGITLFESKRLDGRLVYEPVGFEKLS